MAIAAVLGDAAFGLADASLPLFFGEAAGAAIREHLQLSGTIQPFPPGLCGRAVSFSIRLAQLLLTQFIPPFRFLGILP